MIDLVIDQHHGIPWYAPWWCGTNCIAYIHEVLGPIWDAFYPWPEDVPEGMKVDRRAFVARARREQT